MGRWIIAVGLALTLPVLALGETHEVQVGNLFFSPQNLTIQAGDTVRWVWVEGVHTTTSGDPGDPETTGDVWDSPVTSSNQMFEFTFADPGTFPYFCEVHPASMTGSIIVESGTPVQSATWSSIKKLFEDTSPNQRFFKP